MQDYISHISEASAGASFKNAPARGFSVVGTCLLKQKTHKKKFVNLIVNHLANPRHFEQFVKSCMARGASGRDADAAIEWLREEYK